VPFGGSTMSKRQSFTRINRRSRSGNRNR
jgi:hypothetical protein